MFKKILTFLITLFLITNVAWTFALTDSQKGAILNNFKKKQYDLLFDSSLWDFSNEFVDIFNISKKVDIYDNVWESNKSKREEVERKRIETLSKIDSLEESINQLDKDIKRAWERVTNINKSVIKIKREIEINAHTITLLKTKINDNTEILLDYLNYIYKKSNTIYENDKVDNLKSILLNDENISDLMNDLYFKWIIQVTGKKLIDNHRKFISDLYLNKVKLWKKESNLKSLRKMWIIERKILADKKAYKERILKVSKWKQSYYSKYIKDKLKVEKQLQLKSFQEKVKFNALRNDILKKYNCKFVDLWNEFTAEARSLSAKCLNINKMIYSESKLDESWKESDLEFSWPIEPRKWISAYFHDRWYKKDFWSEHEAVDIIAEQWTSIRAPADWYIVHITPPTTEDYAYVAIKHFDWYMTVYWHVSDVLVKEFDFVKKWDIFAQTWWEFWTLWAWFMTTWPHLHFEVFKDRQYIDPFTILDLSHIQFSRIPEKYEFKFYRDFKNRRWYEFKNKTTNSRVFKLIWDTEVERQQYLINTYATSSFNDWQMWVDESLDWNIDPSFVMCIWLAETTLWRNLASSYNVWNVWNNDRWDRKQLKNARSWIYLIISTLNNKYFNRYSFINEMSWAWRKTSELPSCKEQWTYCYATDTENWHRNVIKCMSHIKWNYVPDNYNFRLIK